MDKVIYLLTGANVALLFCCIGIGSASGAIGTGIGALAGSLYVVVDIWRNHG